MAKKPASKGDHTLDRELIRDLAELLTETGLSEIEVEQADLRIKVVRNIAPQMVEQALVPAAAPAPPVASGAGATAAVAKHAEDTTLPGSVPSPMVGTAYLCPEPGADPFIKVGDDIKEGQILLIVEAMKTMNHIHAPRSGKVTSILVENQQPVEYGEPLLIIE